MGQKDIFSVFPSGITTTNLNKIAIIYKVFLGTNRLNYDWLLNLYSGVFPNLVNHYTSNIESCTHL